MENESLIVIGSFEKIEAEYGTVMEGNFLVLLLYKNEPVSLESFETLEEAMNGETVISAGNEIEVIIL